MHGGAAGIREQVEEIFAFAHLTEHTTGDAVIEEQTHGLFFFAPLNIFANAFVGVAMIALGVQINRTPLNFFKIVRAYRR